MCVAVPCRLVSREGEWGEVQVGESTLRVRLDLVEEAGIGDWLLVHAGFALERLDPHEAEETLRLLREAAGQAARPATP